MGVVQKWNWTVWYWSIQYKSSFYHVFLGQRHYYNINNNNNKPICNRYLWYYDFCSISIHFVALTVFILFCGVHRPPIRNWWRIWYWIIYLFNVRFQIECISCCDILDFYVFFFHIIFDFKGQAHIEHIVADVHFNLVYGHSFPQNLYHLFWNNLFFFGVFSLLLLLIVFWNFSFIARRNFIFNFKDFLIKLNDVKLLNDNDTIPK